ncbi:MAG TPA: zinc-binding dehydrogenase [Flavilitoribacter sp.]|nr:zinc-binding dehydrogenase [Flavilitoribacter sp.]
MKAALFTQQDHPLSLTDLPDPIPSAGRTVVTLRAAALNRRDYFITKGLYPRIITPIILGSDGAGLHNGREVIINPNQHWGNNPAFQSKNYTILGMPDNGTLAEKILVNADRLYPKPAHLNWYEAAALPLGGLTAYRALFTKGGLKNDHKVLVTGIGGGVALTAMQFAVAAGAAVYVTSGSAEKLDKATAMGAAGGADYREENWHEDLKTASGGFDLIIDSAGGPGFNQLIKIANPGARIVTYGGTLGAVPKFLPQSIFWKQITICGTTMGTDQEFGQMLDFVAEHQLQPVVDSVFPLSGINEAFERMQQSDQFGKIIIDPKQ